MSYTTFVRYMLAPLPDMPRALAHRLFISLCSSAPSSATSVHSHYMLVEDWICGVALLTRGSFEDKARFLFRCYDVEGTGRLTHGALASFVAAVLHDRSRPNRDIIAAVSELMTSAWQAGAQAARQASSLTIASSGPSVDIERSKRANYSFAGLTARDRAACSITRDEWVLWALQQATNAQLPPASLAASSRSSSSTNATLPWHRHPLLGWIEYIGSAMRLSDRYLDAVLQAFEGRMLIHEAVRMRGEAALAAAASSSVVRGAYSSPLLPQLSPIERYVLSRAYDHHRALDGRTGSCFDSEALYHLLQPIVPRQLTNALFNACVRGDSSSTVTSFHELSRVVSVVLHGDRDQLAELLFRMFASRAPSVDSTPSAAGNGPGDERPSQHSHNQYIVLTRTGFTSLMNVCCVYGTVAARMRPGPLQALEQPIHSGDRGSTNAPLRAGLNDRTRDHNGDGSSTCSSILLDSSSGRVDHAAFNALMADILDTAVPSLVDRAWSRLCSIASDRADGDDVSESVRGDRHEHSAHPDAKDDSSTASVGCISLPAFTTWFNDAEVLQPLPASPLPVSASSLSQPQVSQSPSQLLLPCFDLIRTQLRVEVGLPPPSSSGEGEVIASLWRGYVREEAAVGDEWFVMPSVWWRQWCEYSRFGAALDSYRSRHGMGQQSSPLKNHHLHCEDEPPLPDQPNRASVSGAVAVAPRSTTTPGRHPPPGAITTASLLIDHYARSRQAQPSPAPGATPVAVNGSAASASPAASASARQQVCYHPAVLQPGLRRGYTDDFVLLPPRVWLALSHWHGVGNGAPAIRRGVISTSGMRIPGAAAGPSANAAAAASTASAALELYPLVVRAVMLVRGSLTTCGDDDGGDPVDDEVLGISSSKRLPSRPPTLVPIPNNEALLAAAPASSPSSSSPSPNVFVFSRADTLAHVRGVLGQAAGLRSEGGSASAGSCDSGTGSRSAIAPSIRLWRRMRPETITALKAAPGMTGRHSDLLSLWPYSPLWALDSGDGDDCNDETSSRRSTSHRHSEPLPHDQRSSISMPQTQPLSPGPLVSIDEGFASPSSPTLSPLPSGDDSQRAAGSGAVADSTDGQLPTSGTTTSNPRPRRSARLGAVQPPLTQGCTLVVDAMEEAALARQRHHSPSAHSSRTPETVPVLTTTTTSSDADGAATTASCWTSDVTGHARAYAAVIAAVEAGASSRPTATIGSGAITRPRLLVGEAAASTAAGVAPGDSRLAIRTSGAHVGTVDSAAASSIVTRTPHMASKPSQSPLPSSSPLASPPRVGYYPRPLTSLTPSSLLGMTNMGNSCFLSSALQCLLSLPFFPHYFLSGMWECDLNTQARLGSGGTLAAAFALTVIECYSAQPGSGGGGSLFGGGKPAAVGAGGGASSSSTTAAGAVQRISRGVLDAVGSAIAQVIGRDPDADGNDVASSSAGDDETSSSVSSSALAAAPANNRNSRVDATSAGATKQRQQQQRHGRLPAAVIAPNRLKHWLAKAAPRFAGTEQHDAQDCLATLFALLSEDLNRIPGPNKPYIEARDSDGRPDAVVAEEWYLNQMMGRDRSIITALFAGQFKSTLTCEKCGHSNVVFEPFTTLSLPLPEPTHVYYTVMIMLGCGFSGSSDDGGADADGSSSDGEAREEGRFDRSIRSGVTGSPVVVTVALPANGGSAGTSAGGAPPASSSSASDAGPSLWDLKCAIAKVGREWHEAQSQRQKLGLGLVTATEPMPARPLPPPLPSSSSSVPQFESDPSLLSSHFRLSPHQILLTTCIGQQVEPILVPRMAPSATAAAAAAVDHSSTTSVGRRDVDHSDEQDSSSNSGTDDVSDIHSPHDRIDDTPLSSIPALRPGGDGSGSGDGSLMQPHAILAWQVGSRRDYEAWWRQRQQQQQQQQQEQEQQTGYDRAGAGARAGGQAEPPAVKAGRVADADDGGSNTAGDTSQPLPIGTPVSAAWRGNIDGQWYRGIVTGVRTVEEGGAGDNGGAAAAASGGGGANSAGVVVATNAEDDDDAASIHSDDSDDSTTGAQTIMAKQANAAARRRRAAEGSASGGGAAGVGKDASAADAVEQRQAATALSHPAATGAAAGGGAVEYVYSVRFEDGDTDNDVPIRCIKARVPLPMTITCVHTTFALAGCIGAGAGGDAYTGPGSHYSTTSSSSNITFGCPFGNPGEAGEGSVTVPATGGAATSSAETSTAGTGDGTTGGKDGSITITPVGCGSGGVAWVSASTPPPPALYHVSAATAASVSVPSTTTQQSRQPNGSTSSGAVTSATAPHPSSVPHPSPPPPPPCYASSPHYFRTPLVRLAFGPPLLLRCIPGHTSLKELYCMVWRASRRYFRVGGDGRMPPFGDDDEGEASGADVDRAKLNQPHHQQHEGEHGRATPASSASTPVHVAPTLSRVTSDPLAIMARWGFVLRRVRSPDASSSTSAGAGSGGSSGGAGSCPICPWMRGCDGCVVPPDHRFTLVNHPSSAGARLFSAVDNDGTIRIGSSGGTAASCLPDSYRTPPSSSGISASTSTHWPCLSIEWDPTLIATYYDQHEGMARDWHVSSVRSCREEADTPISIDRCIDVFSREERLEDAGYCSRCSRLVTTTVARKKKKTQAGGRPMQGEQGARAVADADTAVEAGGGGGCGLSDARQEAAPTLPSGAGAVARRVLQLSVTGDPGTESLSIAATGGGPPPATLSLSAAASAAVSVPVMPVSRGPSSPAVPTTTMASFLQQPPPQQQSNATTAAAGLRSASTASRAAQPAASHAAVDGNEEEDEGDDDVEEVVIEQTVDIQLRHQRKRIELYRLPPILIMQLKRFRHSATARGKVSSRVGFPLDSMCMRGHLAGGSSSSASGSGVRQADGQSTVGATAAAASPATGGVGDGHTDHPRSGSTSMQGAAAVSQQPVTPPSNSSHTRDDDAAGPSSATPARVARDRRGSAGPIEAQIDGLPLLLSRSLCDYTCFAVLNHWGRMGGGHYTCHARSFVGQAADEEGRCREVEGRGTSTRTASVGPSSSSASPYLGTWHCYNDERVFTVADPSLDVVSAGAYILFYVRCDIVAGWQRAMAMNGGRGGRVPSLPRAMAPAPVATAGDDEADHDAAGHGSDADSNRWPTSLYPHFDPSTAATIALPPSSSASSLVPVTSSPHLIPTSANDLFPMPHRATALTAVATTTAGVPPSTPSTVAPGAPIRAAAASTSGASDHVRDTTGLQQQQHPTGPRPCPDLPRVLALVGNTQV